MNDACADDVGGAEEMTEASMFALQFEFEVEFACEWVRDEDDCDDKE